MATLICFFWDAWNQFQFSRFFLTKNMRNPSVCTRVREDHWKSDLDQRSRSDKWSRSLNQKDHLKRKDQDIDQDHPKRSLSCAKDGDIYKCDITYFVTLMSSEISFPNYVEMPSFHKLLFYSNSEGPFFGILGKYTKWSRAKIKGKWI